MDVTFLPYLEIPLTMRLKLWKKISNPEQHLITLKVSKHSQFVSVRLDNYEQSDLDLSTGQFPTTSKSDKDYHNFGLKSMEFVVNKYNGSLTLSKEDNWV